MERDGRGRGRGSEQVALPRFFMAVFRNTTTALEGSLEGISVLQWNMDLVAFSFYVVDVTPCTVYISLDLTTCLYVFHSKLLRVYEYTRDRKSVV